MKHTLATIVAATLCLGCAQTTPRPPEKKAQPQPVCSQFQETAPQKEHLCVSEYTQNLAHELYSHALAKQGFVSKYSTLRTLENTLRIGVALHKTGTHIGILSLTRGDSEHLFHDENMDGTLDYYYVLEEHAFSGYLASPESQKLYEHALRRAKDCSAKEAK